MTAARAQYSRKRVGIEEEGERRTQGERRIGAVGACRVGPGNGQQHLLGRHRGKDLAEPAQFYRNDDDGGEGRHIDQDVFHDRDRRRCPEPAGICESGKDHEGDDERQIGGQPGARYAEGADDDLNADQLEGDVRHGRDDAGDRHRQREPAIAEAAAHEIARRDVLVLVADVPNSRKDQEQDRIDHDGIGDGEERDGPRTEGKRRHGDERVAV